MELDVIVFDCSERRFAAELRYVLEVFSLGYVTPVPLAPTSVHGATNVRGQLIPVIALEPLFALPRPARVLPGHTAVLVHHEAHLAAIPVRRILDVTSVPESRYEAGGEGSGPLIPGSFRGPAGSVPLVDVPLTLRTVTEAAKRANEALYRHWESR